MAGRCLVCVTTLTVVRVGLVVVIAFGEGFAVLVRLLLPKSVRHPPQCRGGNRDGNGAESHSVEAGAE